LWSRYRGSMKAGEEESSADDAAGRRLKTEKILFLFL